ncbi:MAG: hypothetical protein LBV28_00735 [Puniceicoccales bacterium]|jgi:general secretion pathway protein D|nr:hypothetical protein [Puniceicoccales bacterium]
MHPFSPKTFFAAALLLPLATALVAQDAPLPAPLPAAAPAAAAPADGTDAAASPTAPTTPTSPPGFRPGRRSRQFAVEPPAAAPVVAPAAPLAPGDIVGPVFLVDESLGQVITLLEKFSGKTVLRTQTLPILRVNLNAPENLTRAQAIAALETLLTINGVGLVPQGDSFLKAIPAAAATQEAPPLYLESTLELVPTERTIARLFTLKNATPQFLQTSLEPLVNRARGGSIVYMPTANAVLFTDSIAAVQKAERLIEKLDATFTEPMFFKVEHISATEVKRLLQSFQAGLAMTFPGGIVVEADELGKQVMVLSSGKNREKLTEIITRLDKESIPKTVSEVIGIKHSDTSTVFQALQSIVTGSTTATTGGNTSNLSSGGAGTSSSLGGNSNGTNVSAYTYRTYTFTTRKGAGTGAVGARPAVGAVAAALPAPGTPNTYSDYLTVVGEERSNSLVVVGTEDDMREIKNLVAKIDVPLAQVRIEAIVVEVTLSNGEASGLDTLGLGYKTTATGGTTLNGDYRFNTSTPALPSGAPPFAITGSLHDFSLEVIINKAESNSRVRILSAPLISTSHNQRASVFVGQTRPTITSSMSDLSNTTSSRSSVEQKQIGLSLDVLPRVGSDGSVTMQVSQQNQTIAGSIMIDGNETYITAERNASSYLIAGPGETVVLAGLQSYHEVEARGVMWLLGYIPLIGELFKPKTSETERTELIIFLKPHIIDRSKSGLNDTTPGLTPGALTRVDAQSYFDSGRFSAVSLTKAERETIEAIRRRQNEQAKAAIKEQSATPAKQ